MDESNAQRATLTAALAAAGGAIHLAMVPSHAGEWLLEGAAFAVVGWLQLGAAVALLRRPTPFLRVVVAAGTALVVLVWLVSRVAGLPVGPEAGALEPVSFVDLTCAGVEVALLLALALPDRFTSRGRARPLAWSAALGVVVLSTVAMASPSARDHAHGEAGHAHGEAGTVASLAAGHTHPDDFKPYAPMDVADFKQLGEELELVRQVTLRYPTVADALAAGFTRRGAFIPGQGAHLFPPYEVMRQATSPFERPLSWLYSGLEPTSVVVGVMYGGNVDFAGNNERWHHHDDVCVARTPSADGGYETYSESEGMTAAQCAAKDGQYTAHAGPLMHVWAVPGWESPIGVFSHDNPLVQCTDGKKPAEVHHRTGGCRGLA
jgi:hypothetical protein